MSQVFNTLSSNLTLTQYQEKIYDETMYSLEKTGQGAIELFPCGGKSFIGVKIALQYLDNYPGMNILWFGTKAANDNVASSVVSKLLDKHSDRIIFKSYDSVSRGEYSINLELETVCLVVMDESHRALAAQCLDFVLGTLKLCKCDRLAMSATEKRTDGRHSFNVLTPMAIYDEYSISWGAKNSIINEINYSVVITRISQFDQEVYNKYKLLGNTFEDIQDNINEIDRLIQNYSFKFEEDVYNAVNQSKMDLNGANGARHVVFFSKISTANMHKEQIRGIYERLYPDCEIRLFEYNSKQSKIATKQVLDIAVNSEPKPYTVDVIITVNKGTESIHPRGIKSLMLFRGTKSHIVFTQQLGRGITLKDFCNKATYVFDFADGITSVLKGTSIEYGRRTTQNRVSFSDNVSSLEELTSMLKKVLSADVKIKAEFATPYIADLSKRMNSLYSEVIATKKLQMVLKVIQIVNKYYKAEYKKMPGFKGLEKLYKQAIISFKEPTVDGMNPDGSFSEETTQWFKITSNTLLNNNINKEDTEYALIQKCGHLFYLHTDGSEITDDIWMNDIDEINKALTKLDDYANITDRVAGKKLAELRKQNIHNKLSVRTCKYARDMNVDISVDNVSLEEIKKMTSKDEEDAFKHMRTEIKIARQIERNMELIKTESDREITDELNDETNSLWLDLLVKHRVFSIKYDTVYARFLRHKIEALCAKAFKFSRLSITEENNGDRLITMILSYLRGEQLVNLSQEFIFEHAGFKNLSDYCRAIFREFGIKTNSQYEEIIQATKWSDTFKKALDGDDESMVTLLRVRLQGLDDYRRKKLNSLVFKEAKRNMSENTIQLLIMKKAKEFLSEDVERQKEISNAIKNGTVQSIEVGLAPFNSSIADKVENMFMSDDSVECWIEKHKADWTNIYKTCTSSVSCCMFIIPNILSIQSLDKNIATKLSKVFKKLKAM